MNRIFGALAVVLGVSALGAQVAWTLEAPAYRPLPRALHTAAFDTAREVMVVFGGTGSMGPLADTWEWDGANWYQRELAVSPPAREGAAMVYDPIRQVVVLFGGRSGADVFDDTWIYDGERWTQCDTATIPPGRSAHSFAFHPLRGRAMMFGGRGVNGLARRDLWEWDGENWSRPEFEALSPVPRPAPREGAGMVFDPRRELMILFGGRRGSTWFDDTWQWDGVTWTLHGIDARPEARDELAQSMVYDSRRGRIVVTGGRGAAGALGDTWEWDGQVWLQRAPQPNLGALRQHVMVFDDVRGEVVLFGGQMLNRSPSPWRDDTWTYAPIHPASYVPYGQGCSDMSGPPVELRAAPLELPWLGDSFTVDVAAPRSLERGAVMLTGFTNRFWGTSKLPLDLSPAKMVGCYLLIAPEILHPMQAAGRFASWTLALPVNSSIVGLEFFNQAVVIDPVAPGGVVVSNAAEGRIGAK